MERISVAIRVKPTSRQEVSNGSQWKIVENKISLQNVFGASIKGQNYTFDKIFGMSIKNSEIYERAKDLVLSAVSGFNGTVLAYGQTSTGKTYTMQGSASDPGIIRLAIQDVFINIDKIEDREFLVRVSYMEIYNEEINDLLAPENRKLQIYESIEKGIFVAGLREEIADSVEQVIAVLERGEAQRQFAETDMNLNSSRSHTIFRMVIESRDKSHDYKQDNDPIAQDAVRVSTLNLVDLAGSERFSKSGTEGTRSKEGSHINKSLTTLGIVINKLSEGGGKQGLHIPYRDSRLTRILQSALGGNARTAIICTINPDEIHIDETRSTLQFASRAKRVTNCAQVNEILTDAALLKRQKEEIQELRRRLEGSPHTEDLKKEILHLRNDLLKYELGRERLELELQQEMKAQVERERRIKEQEQKIESLSTLVISGPGAVEDRELPPKKRETWCPQSTSSSTERGLRRINSGNDHLSGSASIEVSLQPLAAPGNKIYRPSPPSENLDDDEVDSFWSNSSELDSSPAFGDYQNVADGDIWTGGAQEFAEDAYENTYGNTNLQEQQNEWNFQCQELRPTMDFEIQEKTKAAIATANIALLEEKLRFRNQETKKILDLMKDMEIELKDCHLENSRLRNRSANLHDQTVQDREHVDEGNKSIKQNSYGFETSIQDGHHQQFSGAHCFNTDFARDELGSIAIRDVCTSCHSSLNTIIRLSSMQHGVINPESTIGSSLTVAQDAYLSETVVHEIIKRRLFDDKSGLKFQISSEENSQKWNDSRSIPVTGNAPHSGDITLTASSRLCCRIEQGAGQAAKNGESSRKESTVSPEAENLKSSLHLAYRLGNELLQVLHSIENHDIRCLEGHAASEGTVGKSSEALQVLLLESAHVGLRLLSNLSSKRTLLTPTKLQQLVQEVANIGTSAFQENCGAAGKRSEIDPDDTQPVLQGSVYSLRSTHDTARRQGMNGWSLDSMEVRNSLGQSNTWYQSLDASLPSSQDPGEDICNIDLHQACDEESEVVLSVGRDMQMPDEQGSSEMNQEYQLKVQANEHFAEELEVMRNMSEAEKQFTKELLHKVKVLEAGLTVAEMEIIEYKVEIEHLKMNNLRTSLDASLHCDDWELQNLQVECEVQKEEIRQLMEQVMTPDDELERESLLRETMERNNFLENCLIEAEMRLRRAKDWLEELLQLRDAENQREKSHHDDNQVRSAVLEKGVKFWQGMLKEGPTLDAQLSKDSDSRERLIEVSKSDSLIEPIGRKFQLLSSGSAKTRASLPTSFRKLDIMTTRNQNGTEHLRGRPPRPALRDAQQNSLQPCTSNDLGGYTRGESDIKKLHANDQSEKENHLCPQFPYTASQ